MGTRVNLNVSHANQIYEVSRKGCGKLELGVIGGNGLKLINLKKKKGDVNYEWEWKGDY